MFVSCGGFACCGISAGSTVHCWGNIPQPPADLGKVTYITMASPPWDGDDNAIACAIKAADGRVICWGTYNGYQLLVPPQAQGTNYSSISVSIRRVDGTIHIVTNNGDSSAVQLSRQSGISAVVCGYSHCCYQSGVGGTLACYGDSTFGKSSPPAYQPFALPPAPFMPNIPQLPTSGCSDNIGLSASAPVTDCYDYFSRACSPAKSLRWIQPRPDSAPYQATCNGGYTLAMRIIGNSSSYVNYTSPFWANNELIISGGLDLKLQPFLDFPTYAIGLFALGYGSSLELPMPAAFQGSSLRDLFVNASDAYVPTTGSRAGWIGLLPGLWAQVNCNVQGFNVDGGQGRARLGMYFNDDCEYYM